MAAATSRTSLALSFALVVACGGGPAARDKHEVKAPIATADAGPAADDLLSLDAIAARGAVDAPQMKELARWDRFGARSPELKLERDTCVRIAFAASAAATARVEDARSERRGEATTGPDGVVPPRGPVCFSRGESMHLVIDGAAAARAVVFGAQAAP